jgi:hypothetical protein
MPTPGRWNKVSENRQAVKMKQQSYRYTIQTRVFWARSDLDSPELVAQFVFEEWTKDGKLRQPIFLGLRDDKRPPECLWRQRVTNRGRAGSQQRESSATVAGVRITHSDKVWWLEERITKLDVARYYIAIVRRIMAERPSTHRRTLPRGEGDRSIS